MGRPVSLPQVSPVTKTARQVDPPRRSVNRFTPWSAFRPDAPHRAGSAQRDRAQRSRRRRHTSARRASQAGARRLRALN